MTIFDATERLRERVHAADEATGQHGEWPGPLPLPNELPPVEPFPPEILPPALAPWLIDVAERQAQASNRCKLRSLRAMVVSVAETSGQDPDR